MEPMPEEGIDHYLQKEDGLLPVERVESLD